MYRLRAGAAALLAPLVILTSCSTADTAGAQASLRVGVAAPVLRATNMGSVGLGFHKAALTREPLVIIGPDGRPAPRVVESWEAGPDRLVWRLKIRPGVRFHDGTPVTAAEIAPHVEAELKGSSLGAVQTAVAEGSDVIQITLAEPYAFLLEDISFITAQRVVGRSVFHTGPYAVAEESAERLLLRAVDDHYRGAPAIDRVEVTLFRDQRNAWSALMRDQIDMLYEVSRESLDFVRSESSITVSTFPRPYVYLFGFNLAHPRLRGPRVRQALNLAVDRERLIQSGLAGEGAPAAGHIWPGHWAYDAAAAGSMQYDPRTALKLLDEAGLAVQFEPGRMPARLRLRCLVYEPLRDLALVLQRQLAMVDVDLQLEITPTGELIGRLSAGDFESFVFEMASARTFKFPYQFWHSRAPFLKHGYAGADDVLDRVRRAADDAEFRAAASAVQRRFRDDPPAVFLAWGRTSRAVSTRFGLPATGEDVYHTIARWTPAARTAGRP